MKDARDRLAHRFFRDHDLDFVTVGGCNLMIERLKAQRDRFDALNMPILQVQDQISQYKGDPPKYARLTERKLAEMLREARSRYGSRRPADD